MTGFSLVIEYLTGYAVATDPASRERPEWPPHPARVFMALAAAHFEKDADAEQRQSEREALEWLASLAPPDMVIPNHAVRDVLTVYVPVNDQNCADALVKRSRQPRFFPRVHVGDEPVRLIWRTDTSQVPQYVRAIEEVCRHVTRIGHSSSLVWVRVENEPSTSTPSLVPDEHGLEHRLRVTSSGQLNRLESAYNRDAVEAFAELESQIAIAKGTPKKKLQEQLKKDFGSTRPTSQRPVISLHQGYRKPIADPATVYVSQFDANFIVLREDETATDTFGLESTVQLVDSLRNLIMANSAIQPVPAWVSGHEPNGDKLQSGSHLAIIPMAFIGATYADGHVMGMGILIPRNVSPAQRARVLSPLLFNNQNSTPKTQVLHCGNAGEMPVIRESSVTNKKALQTQSYTAKSYSWASVTPVVLDRMPKADRVKDPIGWREEVAQIVANSCANVGLPTPVAVRVEKTPFFRGSLRAMPGQGGFPQQRKGRFQVHVQIDFDREIEGPVLLGAGRFRGYGLMRPWKENQ